MSFRLRTALVVLALTALTMGGAFGCVWWVFVRSQLTALDRALVAAADEEAASASSGEIELAERPLTTVAGSAELPRYAVLYRRTGLSLSSTKNFVNAPPMPQNVPLRTGFDFVHDGTAMRAVLVRVPNTPRHLLLAAPRSDFEDDAGMLGRAMLVAFAVGCAWAAAVAFGVATRLTRDHRDVAAVARRVALGDTSARVAFTRPPADLAQLAADLNAMIERLVSLLASRERFIANAAHELRTPLTSLQIELEHALATATGPDDYAAAIRGALESASRLSILAEELLTLARLEHGPSVDHASLASAVEVSLSDVSALARARNVSIDAAPIDAEVRGDGPSLARLFRNLFENAIRFSPPGATVRLETDVGADSVHAWVSDEGPGVPAADVDAIFEPFTRGAGEGTGLGLTIARSTARAVGGDVVASPGPGGRFLVVLPLVARSAASPASDDAT